MTDRYITMSVPGRTDEDPGHWFVYDRTGQRSRPAADYRTAHDLAVAMNRGEVLARIHVHASDRSSRTVHDRVVHVYRVFFPTGHTIDVEAESSVDAIKRAREVQS